MPLQHVRQPFDHRDWLYELKLDGFRALAHVQGGRCVLISRNGNQLNGFQPLCDAIAKELGPVSAILDGEIVCLHQKDGPEFFRLCCKMDLEGVVAKLKTAPYVHAREAST